MNITNVMATSVDGRIASRPEEPDFERRSLGFLGEADRGHVLGLLAEADAVVIGAGSVRASGAGLASALPPGKGPRLWAVMSRQGLPLDHPLYSVEGIERWLVGPQDLPVPAGKALSLTYGQEGASRFLHRRLAEFGAENVLLFGGSEINRSFYEAGLVDELILTVCPVIFGSSASVPLIAPEMPQPVSLSLVASQSTDNLVFLKYRVNPV